MDMREKRATRQQFNTSDVCPIGVDFKCHSGLFDHVWLDGTSVALGYGDGTIAVLDARMGQTVQMFREKNKQLENLAWDSQTQTFASFGRYSSFWSVNGGEWTQLGSYAPKYERSHHNAGALLGGIAAITAADSSLVLVDTMSKES